MERNQEEGEAKACARHAKEAVQGTRSIIIGKRGEGGGLTIVTSSNMIVNSSRRD